MEQKIKITAKITDKLRKYFFFIVFTWLLYFGYSLVQSDRLFNEWQDAQSEELEHAVAEWLSKYRLTIDFSAIALKPKKFQFEAFIEDDNFRAIQVLLQESKALFELDYILLETDRRDVVSDAGLVEPLEKKKLQSLLDRFSQQTTLHFIDERDLNMPSKDDNKALYYGKKIPIYYDVGDIAGSILILKKISVADIQNIRLKNIQIEFIANQGFKNKNQVNKPLFLSNINQLIVPVYDVKEGNKIGQFQLQEYVENIRWMYLNLLINSLLPLFLLSVVLWLIYRNLLNRVINPVKEMSVVAEDISNNNAKVRLTFMNRYPETDWTEVDVLGIHFNQLMDNLATKQQNLTSLNETLEAVVIKRTRALVIANKELEKQAHTDALTGIGNRHAFDIIWDDLLSSFRAKTISEAGIAIIDVDFFKAVNDTYGHSVGDRVLKLLSQTLKKVIKDAGVVTRLGGDEFAVVFVEHSAIEIMSYMQKVVEIVKSLPVEKTGVQTPLSVSVGFAIANQKNKIEVYELIKHADAAMYVAKQSLSTKVVLFDKKQHAQTEERLDHQKTQCVLDMIESGKGLKLFFQPIYNLKTHKVDYFEALSRIETTEGLMYPNDFMPIIERTQHQVNFDAMVIQAAKEVLESGVIKEGCGLSVNLSAESLASDKVCEMFSPLVPFLTKYKIVVEITETTLITQLNEVSGYIERFKESGFEVALDDFGSGYSSIGYLAHLPVDIIKFDITLARAAFQKERSAKLIQSLVHDLSDMGYKIVVEGIEDEPMFQSLAAMSPSHFQGYYINRPEPEPDDSVEHFVKYQA